MFKVLTGGCNPTRGTKYSACVDLYASEDVTIGAGETKLIGLGVAIDFKRLKSISDRDLENKVGLPLEDIENGDGDADIVYYDAFRESHYLQLMLRSSLGKKGLILPNGVGIIDMDYKDEIKMIIHNPFTLKTVMNVAIDYVNRTIEALSSIEFRFSTHKVKRDGFDMSGAFVIKKEDPENNVKATKVGQITLVEHKSYLFGVESDVKRDGGFGSTDKKKN